KYVFQQGGDATGADMFNQYVDQILASGEQQQQQQAAQQPQTPEQDEYLENLRAYDEEFTLQRQSEEIDLRLSSIEQKLDAQIRNLTSMHEEFNYFNTSQGQEMIAQMYEAADETVPFDPYFNIGSTYKNTTSGSGSSSGDKKG